MIKRVLKEDYQGESFTDSDSNRLCSGHMLEENGFQRIIRKIKNRFFNKS